MTPQFWQHLITQGDGSEIRFVAGNEREAAEKELEGTPGLLSYRAKPQIHAQCFADLTNEYCSSFGGHNHKKWR